MDLLAALDNLPDHHTLINTAVIAGVILVVAGLVASFIKTEPALAVAGAIVGMCVFVIPLFGVGIAQGNDQRHALAQYLLDEHHLTATDPIDLDGTRAITKVVTADGTIQWAEINWVAPDDVYLEDTELPDDYEPVTVTLTDTKPTDR